MRKRSCLTASCQELVYPFRNCRCTGRHEHASTTGQGKSLHQAQVWTWDEAQRVVEGIRYLLESERRGYTVMPVAEVVRPKLQAYPKFDIEKVARPQPGVPQAGYDSRAKPHHLSSCPGCRYRRSRNDWTHTRVIGECGYPHDEPQLWECEACMDHLPRATGEHLLEPGKCRFATNPKRAYAPRRGHHPRDPARRATADPTAGLPGTGRAPDLGEPQELGAAGEARIDEEQKAAAAAAARRDEKG